MKNACIFVWQLSKKIIINSLNHKTMDIIESCPTKAVTSATHTRWCIEVANLIGGVVCSHDISQGDFPIFSTFVKIGDICFDCEGMWEAIGDEIPVNSNDMLLEDARSLGLDEVEEILKSIECWNESL